MTTHGERMRAVWEACEAAGIDPPEDVVRYLHGPEQPTGTLAPGWAARQAAQPDPHQITEK